MKSKMNAVVGEKADLLMKIDQLESRIVSLHGRLTNLSRTSEETQYVLIQLIQLNQMVLKALTNPD